MPTLAAPPPPSFDPTSFAHVVDAPFLFMCSARVLQEPALVQALERNWSVFMAERNRLLHAESPNAMDIDIVVDERTAISLCSAEDFEHNGYFDALLLLILRTARVCTTLWLIVECAFYIFPRIFNGIGRHVSLPPSDAFVARMARLQGMAWSAHAAGLSMPILYSETRAQTACYIRLVGHATRQSSTVWTPDKWQLRDWLESVESKVRFIPFLVRLFNAAHSTSASSA